MAELTLEQCNEVIAKLATLEMRDHRITKIESEVKELKTALSLS